MGKYIKNKLAIFIAGLVIGVGVLQIIEPKPVCKLPVDNPRYEPYNNLIVSGTTVRAAIDLLSDGVILIINKNSDDDNYAIINNMTLWDNKYINKTEYGYWISKKSFQDLLAFDDIRNTYVTPMNSLDGTYGSNNTALGTDEYVSASGRYKANLIEDFQNNVLGIVFEIQ